MKLNESVVKALPVPQKNNKVTYFAGAMVQGSPAPKGFGVRVSASGKRSFVLNYWHQRREFRITLGAYPDWSVLKAVREARELRQRVDRGENPLADRAPLPTDTSHSVETVLRTFLARYVNANKLRSAAEIERSFDRYVIPRIGRKSILAVQRRDVVEMLDAIEDQNGPVMADRVLAYLRKAFNWHAARDDKFVPPIVKGMARTKPAERARQRVLDDDELRDVWAAIDGMGSPYREYLRTLLLTAARRQEVSEMRWEEIDGAAWTVPATKYKTKIANTTPLTATVLVQLGPAKSSGYVFSKPAPAADRPFSGFSKCKRNLDKRTAAIRAERGQDEMAPWVLHDLRRTARSLMSRAGVSADVGERVLGHVISGVRGVYDRHAYIDEKRDALERLEREIMRIVAKGAARG